MRTMFFTQAVDDALAQAMVDNPRIILFGEDTKITGGHAFALVGYNQAGFVVQNSWGTGWGEKGYGWLGDYSAAHILVWPSVARAR